MKSLLISSLFCLFPLNLLIFGQNESSVVGKTFFSTDKYDEFSPVYYKNGIVFCSNRIKSSLLDYSDSKDIGQFKIYFIDTTSHKLKWRKSELFSKKLTSKMNNGPVTFNSTFDTIYLSRNIMINGRIRDLGDKRNKLGLFSAFFNGKKWDNIKEFRFNSEWYNITAPFLTNDGSKLYFASDLPGGYGGLDLYCCNKINGQWNDPVNLGPVINSSGNESFPFINEAGELFFSSDGHGGLGGKDIFVTRTSSTGWAPPVDLKPPVNSEKNDFGILTDGMALNGFFSSDRQKSVDIYDFHYNSPQFWFSEIQQGEQYCFNISDRDSIEIDSMALQYVWTFGGTEKIQAKNTIHCFSGPGIYSMSLDIIDKKTGKLFFHKLSTEFEIVNDHPFINCPDEAMSGANVKFDGLKSVFPGYKILDYYWDFGDGVSSTGPTTQHTYNSNGEYKVQLGLILQSLSNGVPGGGLIKRSAVKKIVILKSSGISNIGHNPTQYLSLMSTLEKSDNIRLILDYSAEEESKKDAVFQVLIKSSKTRIPEGSPFFGNLPSSYNVKESFDSKTGLYSYIVDEEMSLMATYQAYTRMVTYRFPDTEVRIFVLTNPEEKELYRIKKVSSLLADDWFDLNNYLTTRAYLVLDQVVIFLNKYPDLGLDIAVHTDNQGTPVNLQKLSEIRAQTIINYVVSRGIKSDRLTAKGYGDTRPILPNIYPTYKRANRRIDFNIRDHK